ncbi:hypothetical protein K788_00003110 [Paraburkholderia caribensis MBA4]|uniref:Uncharacterized protein n=1 Tax=Paraburkholderia caribensis MBA4 TaxID=1323664 RepID=A0A0P0RHY8_9BURK|nr:hypothetical protein K788_00003110 [Paraburkholderia caribensis MBA4]
MDKLMDIHSWNQGSSALFRTDKIERKEKQQTAKDDPRQEFANRDRCRQSNVIESSVVHGQISQGLIEKKSVNNRRPVGTGCAS